MCSHRRVAAATRAIDAPAVVSIILSRRNGRPPHRSAPLLLTAARSDNRSQLVAVAGAVKRVEG
jgi:hypothetical protein